MRRLHLALQGQFRARLGDGTAIPVRRRKARALLAYLAMRLDDPQPRERLLPLLWPDADATEARHSLRQTLTVLRRDLAPLRWPATLLSGEALCLSEKHVGVDVADFDRMARSQERGQLERAADLYRGEFLEGLRTGADGFDTWLAAERERLRAGAVQVLDRLLALHLAAGASAAAQRVAMRVLALDPLREDTHRVVMRLHAGAGRRASALRQYEACAAALRRELDVAPEAETTALYRALRARGVSDVADGADAVRLNCLAADGAVLRSEFREAVACLERALAANAESPAGRRRRARDLEVRLGFERALVPLGESDRLDAELDEAEADARALGDRRRQGWVIAQRMSRDFLEGQAEAAVARGANALEIAADTGDAALARAARHRLAQAYYWAGDFPRASRHAGELATGRAGELSLAASVQGVLPAVHCRAYLALALTAVGHFERGRAAAVDGERLAERSGHDWSLAFARSTLGVCEIGRGRAREACEAFAGAVALQCPSGGTPRFVLPGDTIGYAYAYSGRTEEGLRLVEAAVRAVAPRGLGPTRMRGLPTLARWRLREGRVGEARELAEEALRLTRAQGQRAEEARALLVLAEVLDRIEATTGSTGPRPSSICLDALARARTLGMLPLAARCQSTLGDLLERAGDVDGARRARAAAQDLRAELGLGPLAGAPGAATRA